ncbi:capsid [uncultured virus]|uniref:Capsid n=1 Tax=uncultured virus TaxID=340016 RepID=A0A2K9LSM9_9VIRU|nr:capsid [uncultured virus]
MVYRRRYNTRRRPRRYGRKKIYRRRFRRSTRTSKKGQKLYLFKRYVGTLGSLVINNINPTFAGYNFSLNDVPNYTEFTDLYDSYKINCIKVYFIPQMTSNVSLGTVNNAWASARFFSAIDYNDATAPTSIDDLRQYQSCKMTSIMRQHKRVIFKPKILDTSSYTLSPWMATSSPSTNYYGLKVGVEPMSSTSSTTMTFNIEAVFYMSFKQVK